MPNRCDEGESKPHHPPDLYDYIPAQLPKSDKQLLDEQLQRQAFLLDTKSSIGILLTHSLPHLLIHIL